MSQNVLVLVKEEAGTEVLKFWPESCSPSMLQIAQTFLFINEIEQYQLFLKVFLKSFH